MAEEAYIGLGSNLGDPLENLRQARRELARLGDELSASHLYRTAPVGGPAGQGDYLNAVVALRPLPNYSSPEALLAALLDIEQRHGRLRRVKWEARTLDLDLLALGRQVVDRPGLTLPHPLLLERPFVLAPLCEIAPEWRHPLSGERAATRLEALGSSGVSRTDLEWDPG